MSTVTRPNFAHQETSRSALHAVGEPKPDDTEVAERFVRVGLALSYLIDEALIASEISAVSPSKATREGRENVPEEIETVLDENRRELLERLSEDERLEVLARLAVAKRREE